MTKPTEKSELAVRPAGDMKTLKTVLESARKDIEGALPKHLTPERMLRITFNEARKNSKLLQCDIPSFFGSVIQACQLGLEPGGALGHCFFVPFYNKARAQHEVQFIVGYKGMIQLANNSPKVSKVEAHAVFEGDDFQVQYGMNERLAHIPKFESENLTHVYALITLRDGTKMFEVMTKAQVEKIRSFSQSRNAGTWADHFDEMARKTAIRRLFKYAPVSVEAQQAVALDELADAGVGQDNHLAFPAEPKQLPQAREEELRNLVSPGSEPDLSEEEKFPFEKQEDK